MMRSVAFVFSTFFLLPVHGVQATSVVAVRTPTTVILGADSRLTTGIGLKDEDACKIGVSNKVFWAEAGTLRVKIVNFSVDGIAAASMAKTRTLSDRIADFENSVAGPLTGILNNVRTSDPVGWVGLRYVNRPALEIAFAAFEGETPYLYVRDFIVRQTQTTGEISLEITRTDSPTAKYPGDLRVLLGRNEAAGAEFSQNPTIFDTLGPILAVRHLIEMEVLAVPNEVGPPISIVEITNSGPHWVAKGKCESQE